MARFTQEQLLAAYQRAPEAIQDAFGSEVMTGVVEDLKTRYRLHVDIAGELDREIGYLMLGLVSPAEFFGQLMLSGTDEQSARGIMQEVNDRIFIPLKHQMKAGAPLKNEDTAPSAPSPTPRISREPIVPVPAIEYGPALAKELEHSEPASAPDASPQIPPIQSTQSAEFAMPVVPRPEQPARTMSVPTPEPIRPTSPIQKGPGSDPYREPV